MLSALLVAVAAALAPALLEDSELQAQGNLGEPTLDAIMDGWADAIGGRDRLSQAGTMKFTFRTKMSGLEGDLVVWSSPEGQQRVDLNLADMFKVTQVFDRDHGWMVDQNGKLNELTGMQLAGEITGAYLGTWSHLLPGRMQGSVEYVGREEETGLLQVQISPEGGDVTTFFLDPETYLPVRSERPSSERVSVTTYSDWQTIEGIKFAGRFTQSTGNAQFDSSFELVNGELNQTAPAHAFAKPQEDVDDVVFTAGGEARDIPIELHGVHIFVQVTVGDSSPLWFILDTGAAVTVVETETAKELGLEMKGEIEARGAGEGSQQASFISNMTYQVGTAKLEDQKGVAIPLEMLEPMFGREIHGVLGYDFISRFVMVIDYDQQKLHLFNRKDYAYGGSGTVVPIRIEHGHPHMTATVTPFGRDPMTAEFLIDTGAGSAVGFARPFVEKNDLLATPPKKFLYQGGGGVGGTTRSYMGRIEKIEIENLALSEPICGFSQDQGGAGANPDLAGLIGGEVLQRFTVIFDYEHNRMILEPGEKYEKPFDQNMSGLALKTGGPGEWHKFTVRYVQENSPAARAGIEVGDAVLSFDGHSADELTLAKMQKMVRGEPRTIQVVIERDGEEMTKELKLEPMV
jgi:predicted aspartyl protease